MKNEKEWDIDFPESPDGIYCVPSTRSDGEWKIILDKVRQDEKEKRQKEKESENKK
ncbi:MAG: hypothetical protein LBT51_00570 [Fusobacteriaceae bacterium]|jgi:hypothetical protein|nr:hypothetical protein [Fusobacteriaceae bacterium]